jgi:hypothetical protein
LYAQEVMEQFKRVLERFMPQDEADEGEQAADAAGGRDAGAAAAADGAGPAHSDADSDEQGEQVSAASLPPTVRLQPACVAAVSAAQSRTANSLGGSTVETVPLRRTVGVIAAVSSDEGGEGQKLSKKQRKLLHRLKIAELKQQCPRPDVVEVWDVTAPDPQTLVTLKVCIIDSSSSARAVLLCWSAEAAGYLGYGHKWMLPCKYSSKQASKHPWVFLKVSVRRLSVRAGVASVNQHSRLLHEFPTGSDADVTACWTAVLVCCCVL